MVRKLKNPIQLAIILIILFTSACSATSSSPTLTEPTQVSLKVIDTTPTETPLPSFTPEPTPTSTPDLRIPPERWKEWPVVPQVTNRSRQIYAEGLKLGLDPHGFSKIGDCQNVKNAFLGFFDIAGYHDFWFKSNPELEGVISWFKGEFDTDGAGVRQGLTAAAAMTTLWSDPQLCNPNESPVMCEIRTNRPTFVTLSFERNWEGRTSETYEKYMRKVIEYVLSQGVVPILMTKADNMEGDHSINFTTARLAYEYDLPLINFWRAVQSLPDHGMDAKRNDGFHTSVAAWYTRSFITMETLDVLWRGLSGAK
jgi:hypothetical protein